jgi:hypothetical protein
LHGCVDGQHDDFAHAHSGACKQFHDQPDQRVGVGAGGDEQFRDGGVVKESLSAERAKEIGLVWKLVEPEEQQTEARAWPPP